MHKLKDVPKTALQEWANNEITKIVLQGLIDSTAYQLDDPSLTHTKEFHKRETEKFLNLLNNYIEKKI